MLLLSPLQLNIALVGSRNVFCLANKSEKSNLTLNIEAKGVRKPSTVKNQSFQKYMEKISLKINMKNEKEFYYCWERIFRKILSASLKLQARLFSDNLKSKQNMEKKFEMIKHLSQKGLISIALESYS